jgi:hypothetical protein
MTRRLIAKDIQPFIPILIVELPICAETILPIEERASKMDKAKATSFA